MEYCKSDPVDGFEPNFVTFCGMPSPFRVLIAQVLLALNPLLLDMYLCGHNFCIFSYSLPKGFVKDRMLNLICNANRP